MGGHAWSRAPDRLSALLTILDAMSSSPTRPSRSPGVRRRAVTCVVAAGEGDRPGLIDLGGYTERSATGDHRAHQTGPQCRVARSARSGDRRPDAGRGAAAARPSIGPAPGFSGAVPSGQAGVLELTGWGSREFKGYWVVPPNIVIGRPGATTKLDFTAAQLTSPIVTVEFRSNYGGACLFIVPHGRHRPVRRTADARREDQRSGRSQNGIRGDDPGADRHQEGGFGDDPSSQAGHVREPVLKACPSDCRSPGEEDCPRLPEPASGCGAGCYSTHAG